jgi:hypothetical protein
LQIYQPLEYRNTDGAEAVEQRALGCAHPLEVALAHFAEDLLAGGVGEEVDLVVGNDFLIS